MFEKILENVHAKTPLTHMMTNYVTVNDCANVILACGGSPIMADDIGEAAEITAICCALGLNIGTLNQRTIASMLAAGKAANALGHPVLLDPVGAGASKLRTETAFRLLQEVNCAVVRGNTSEIKVIASGAGSTRGVDADMADAVTEENLEASIAFIKATAARFHAVIAMTGKIDLVGDAERVYVIRNGDAHMSRITGTGCMLSAMMSAYIGANPEHILEAAAAAVCAFGYCGELAARALKAGEGTMSFRNHLIDALSTLDMASLNGGKKVEIR